MNSINNKILQKFFNVAFIAILIFFSGLFQVNSLYAQENREEKKFCVIEDSDNDGDETHYDYNSENLPPGSEAIEAENLKEAVDEILDELDDEDCIKELHFRGHGSNGNQSVGDGIHHEAGKRINGNNEWKVELGRLKDRLCDDALVHLWGCNVGRCNEGAAKLKEIADFLGVTAKGTVNKVYAGGQNTYNGPIQTATPDQPQPACMNSTDDNAPAPAGGNDQVAEMELNMGISLDSIAVNPEAVWIELSMTSVLSYFEEIVIPGCPAVYPELLDLYGFIGFGSLPEPGLISFNLYEMYQSLGSFDICGYPTGMNHSLLLPNFVASGTINTETGDIVGTATVLHSNNFGEFIVPNIVTGTWEPTNSEILTLSFSGPLAGPPNTGMNALAMVTFIVKGSGDPATITRDSVTEELQTGDEIRIYNLIETNSDRVQFHDAYGCMIRMGEGAVMEMMPPRQEIAAMYPGLTFSSWYHEGEILLRGGGDGKYRNSCYIGNHSMGGETHVVFLQPGSSEYEDAYYSLDEYITVWDDFLGAWTELFELGPGDKGTLQVIDSVYQLPPLIESITAEEIAYIHEYYLNDSIWGAPEPHIWTEPLNLGPGINSDVDDFAPRLSQDMLTMYFVSKRPDGYGENDIWMSTRSSVDDEWTDPVNPGPNINTEYDDLFACLSPDMLALYFSSNRPGGYGDEDLYKSTRNAISDDWGEAVNLGPVINTEYCECQPRRGSDDMLYFCSDRPEGYGSGDIWMTTYDSTVSEWEDPVNLGPPVNTGYGEWNLSMSSDNMQIFFDSDDIPVGLGSSDFWMSTLDSRDGLWKTPVNLGAPVNSEYGEWTPWICHDGVTLYFATDRPGGYGDADLWLARDITTSLENPIIPDLHNAFAIKCYPNPFREETSIAFTLDRESEVSLILYNLLGQSVRTIADQNMKPGYHSLHLQGRDDNGNYLGNGIYVLKIQAGNRIQTHKLILVR